MADDFGEFAAFTSAFSTTSTTTTSKGAEVSKAKSDGAQDVTDKTNNLFSSFPLGDQPPSDVQFSFDFGDKLEGINSGADFANFDMTNTNIADIHIPLDLPSPPAMDVHMAGGVPFDIPPMPLSPSEEMSTTVATTSTFSAWPQASESGSQSTMQHVNDTNQSSSTSFFNTIPNSTTSTLPNSESNPLTVENNHPTADNLSSAVHNTGKEDQEEFGDFESSLTFSNSKSTSNNTNTTATSAGTSGVQLPLSSDSLNKSNDDSFGSFVADSNSRTQAEEDLTFGSFESSAVTSFSDTNKIEEVKKTTVVSGESQFAGFGAFQQTSSESQQQGSKINSEFGSFDAFVGSSGTEKGETTQHAEFGDFSAFKQASELEKSSSGNKTENTMELQARHTGQAGKTSNGLDFANFESAPSLGGNIDKDNTTTDKTGGSDFTADFTAFESSTVTTSSAMSDDFGSFGAFTGQTTSSHTNTEFGDFSGVKSDTTFTSGAGSKGDDDSFGDFNSGSKKDDFGDFSSSTSAFGDFSSAPAVAPLPVATSVPAKKVSPVLQACFTGKDSQHSLPALDPTSLFQRLLKEQQKSSDLQGVWQVLQKSVDFTVPLHKWNKSYMQGIYYEALKIDPVLASKPSALPIIAGGMGAFEAPLGGATAAEDLMEAFGFQGDLEVSPTTQREFKMGSPGAPALLDLSLPATPTSPTNKNSFTIAQDLLGLDLNPQQQSQALSSVEELVRNERLVVSKSTWVDSKLLELGGESSVPSETTSPPSNSQPSTPRSGKKQNSVELQLLQLGLDVSKTTFTSGSSDGELSLSARSLLGRLPDLSFMLANEEIVHSTYYSSRSK